jgi:hypothetical protein
MQASYTTPFKVINMCNRDQYRKVFSDTYNLSNKLL